MSVTKTTFLGDKVDSISAIPQQPQLGRLAQFLRYLETQSPEFLPKQLDVMGLVRQLALPQASTVENLSYGNLPFTMPPEGTGALIPQVKTGRKAEVADLVSMLSGVPGGKAVADVGTKISNEAADALVRMITRNPQATATGVIQETAMPVMQAVAPKLSGLLDQTALETNKISNKLKELGFYSDIPNENWLKSKIEYVEEKGYNKYDYPRVPGATTGSFKNNTVLVPIEILKKIPGAMGEQSNVRKESLDYLTKEMASGRLPKTSSGEDYKPFITVDHRGKAFISEGNHRIMAAEKLGFDYLPVEVKYYNGGERVNSLLSPENLAKYTLEAEDLGYSINSYAKPKQ